MPAPPHNANDAESYRVVAVIGTYSAWQGVRSILRHPLPYNFILKKATVEWTHASHSLNIVRNSITSVTVSPCAAMISNKLKVLSSLNGSVPHTTITMKVHSRTLPRSSAECLRVFLTGLERVPEQR